MEGDVLDRDAVHLRLRLGEDGEDGRRPLRDRAGESALAEPRPDVREAAVGVGVAVAVAAIPTLVAVAVMMVMAVMVVVGRVMALPDATGRGGVEAPSPEDPVRERLGADGDDLVQARLGEPRRKGVRALGKGVEKGGGEHVAGHAADRIQVDVHRPDSNSGSPFSLAPVYHRGTDDGPDVRAGESQGDGHGTCIRLQSASSKAIVSLFAVAPDSREPTRRRPWSRCSRRLSGGPSAGMTRWPTSPRAGPSRGRAPIATSGWGPPGRSRARRTGPRSRRSRRSSPPRYGGYCAWAVSRGYTASIDPDAWRIVDGALYLNYSLGVQKRWEKDIPGNIAKADGNWPRLLEE